LLPIEVNRIENLVFLEYLWTVNLSELLYV
jgi:hypothetical protein